jgi:gliding motility-associated-like protein
VILTGSITNAQGGIWSSSGSGTFVPNNTSTLVAYFPSSADITSGNVIVSLASSGNGNCLQVTNTISVNFISNPVVFAGNNFALCPNVASPTLTGSSNTGSGIWTTSGTGTFSPSNTILNPVYIPSALDNSAGTVTLILNSGNLTCGSASDSLVVSFNVNPIPNFTLANRCVNSVSSFTDLSIPVSGSLTSWLWHFDSDTTKFQNPSYTFTTTGNHTVSLVVSNGACKDSISTTIFINPLPVSAFTFSANCKDPVVFVQSASVTPGNITNWNWNFGDASPVSILQNPVHLYSDTGYYQVTLLVKSDSNCVADYKSTVHVVDCEVVIISNPAVPSGFTPNGDGRNDVLYVKGGPFKTLEFRIFNEWGAQIFISTIQSSGWDGTFKASEQAGGRYIWTVIGELIDGRQVKMSGEVILTR